MLAVLLTRLAIARITRRTAPEQLPLAPVKQSPASERPVSTERPITWRSGWVALLASLAARMILVAGATLVLWSVAPAAIGWHPTVTMSGSMEPAIHPGDVVISRPIGHTRLRAGMIILADDPDATGNHAEAELLVHRIHHVNAHHTYTTKGDANAVTDSDPVTPGHVHGLAVLLVPWIGHPYLWAHTHHLGALAGFTALTALLIWLAALHHEPHDPNDPPRSRRRRTTAALAATAVIWPLDPAHAAYTSTNANTANTLAAGYYSCQRAPLASAGSLSLFYKFDETTGSTAADASGTSNTGTYTGGYTLTQTKACATDTGYSAYFNGSIGYAYSTTSFASPQTFTEEIWFKTTTTSGGDLISFGSSRTGSSGSHDRHVFMANDGRITFGVYPSTVKTVTSTASYNDGAWHLADATFSPTTGMNLYIDGSLVGSDATVTSAQSFTGYWRVGYDSLASWGSTTPSSYYFNGYLDDAAVYTTALSASTIAAHYAARS